MAASFIRLTILQSGGGSVESVVNTDFIVSLRPDEVGRTSFILDDGTTFIATQKFSAVAKQLAPAPAAQ